MNESRHKVAVTSDDGKDLGTVGVSMAKPARSKATAVIAHGAGGTMETPSIISLQKRLAGEGVTAIRFNFIYSETGQRSPDAQPKLLATWRAVADWAKKELRPKRFILAGRSMGGRMASYLVAEGYPCSGIFFLAYPLHPPGKPDRLRKDHLPNISVPMLFISGTRDNFAQMPLLEPTVEALKSAQLYLIEGADHGFKVPKKYGKTAKDVDDEVAETVLTFVRSLQ